MNQHRCSCFGTRLVFVSVLTFLPLGTYIPTSARHGQSQSASQSALETCQSARSSDVVLWVLQVLRFCCRSRQHKSKGKLPRYRSSQPSPGSSPTLFQPANRVHTVSEFRVRPHKIHQEQILQLYPFVSSLPQSWYSTIPPSETTLLLSIYFFSFRQILGLQDKNPLRRVRTGSPAPTDRSPVVLSRKGSALLKVHFRYLHYSTTPWIETRLCELVGGLSLIQVDQPSAPPHFLPRRGKLPPKRTGLIGLRILVPST